MSSINNPVLDHSLLSGITTSDHHIKTEIIDLVGAQNYNPSAASTWEDWDISAIIPAGAKGAMVEMASSLNTGYILGGARKNGTAINRYAYLDQATVTTHRADKVLPTECDASRIIEVYSQGVATNVYFNIVGYWT